MLKMQVDYTDCIKRQVIFWYKSAILLLAILVKLIRTILQSFYNKSITTTYFMYNCVSSI